MKVFARKENANDFFNITGDFGKLKSEITINNNTYGAKNGKIAVNSQIEEYDNGVKVRRGTVKNISNENVTLNTLSSNFTFDGGEYEVYTQSNVWQNESDGIWQPLVTSVSARCTSVRNACEAAPFMALWSNQHNRGVAFHICAYSAWEMRVSRMYLGDVFTYIEAEMGILSEGLSLTLKPEEEAELPEIIYYNIENKTDFDCWKLHGYLNKMYPRKELPVAYNSWLYKFDKFTYDDILKQISKAKELGVEYFVIDAGWFGKGAQWWNDRGDWEENQTFGFCGRMCEIAEETRKNGMKFGFWLEPECASVESDAVKNHPEYFIEGCGSYFVDFANEDAKQYIFNKVCELIDRFDAKYVKFDFNADLKFDKYHSGFTKYAKGHTDFIKMLKEKYPDLYINDCASGGFRVTVRDGKLYNDFWPSDNQSIPFGLKIFKNTMLRLAPQWLGAVISVRSAENFSYVYAEDEMADKLFTTNDATWNSIVSVNKDVLKGFLMGHPIYLSFDLTNITDDVFCELKEYIKSFKENRDFWHNAVCHILTDTETMLVLEFRNDDFSQVEIVVFAKKIMQNNICVYPVLNNDYSYTLSGDTETAAEEIAENGIDVPLSQCHTAKFITLKKH